jgi:hypothetical protein
MSLNFLSWLRSDVVVKSEVVLEVHDLGGDDFCAVCHLLNAIDAEQAEAEVGPGKRVVPGIAAKMRVLDRLSVVLRTHIGKPSMLHTLKEFQLETVNGSVDILTSLGNFVTPLELKLGITQQDDMDRRHTEPWHSRYQ